MEPEDELKRGLRAAMRSLEAAKIAILLEDAHQHVVLAIHQLALVLERLVDERSKGN
jgi:hypothetical protein